MGAATAPLASLEVAVRRRSAALSRLQPVGIHRQAHGTTGLTPFEAGLGEYLVQAFFLGLMLDQPRAGDDQCTHAVSAFGPAPHASPHPKFPDPPVGARADEDGVDRDLVQLL